MDIIITHVRTDFDAFASLLLAHKLFPQAQPILPSQLIYKLKEFTSLYRDVADYPDVRRLKNNNGEPIEHVIIVDTKKLSQLYDFKPYIKAASRVSIFDHHPPTSDDLHSDYLEMFEYGANTTGMLLKLEQERGLDLTPAEATIVMLGIYADTGNLTYPGTSAQDALAAGRMLSLGADLQTVNRYLRPYFDPVQRHIFREMMSEAREYDMEGYKVVMIKQELEKPMQGLSVLVAQAGDMLGADAIMGVFSSHGKPAVQLILQSHVPEVNVGELAAYFDGGGHPGAAAAHLPKADLEGVADTLFTLLTEVPLPTTKVRDMMTPDVYTISPHISLKESAELMTKQGIRGAPVVNKNGKLIGMISMRDIEKAGQQDRLHIPIKGFMTHKVLTVSPDMPLVSAKKMISSHNIGHLPVMENGRIVGMLSRTDVLKVINGNGADLLAASA